MKSIISITVLIFLTQVFAGGIIKGKVINPERNPMPEANITVIGSNLGAATNDKGSYYIRNIPEGQYNILCSYIGHKDELVKGVTIKNDSTIVMDFLLFPHEYQLESIEVEENKENLNSLLYYRDLAGKKFLHEYNVEGPAMKDIEIDVKPGFWERFRYFFYKMFN